MIDIQPARFQFATLRLQPGDPGSVLAAVQEIGQQIDPSTPLTYQFVDQTLDQLYLSEARLGRLLGTFTVLSMVLGCLGLFALATFTTEQRTKEMGIRKVLGASVSQVVWLLTGGGLKLVGLGCLIAFPLVFVVMQRWLSNFAYHTEIGASVFLIGGGLVLAMALLSTGYQALTAATRDPVLSLKSE